MRLQFLYLGRDDRKALLSQFVDKNEPHHVFIDGHRTCWTFLNKAFELSHQVIANCRKMRSANASHLPGRMGGIGSSVSKASQVMAFLTELADAMADEYPNSSERHLPHGTKDIVYSFYCERACKIGQNPCTKPYFYKIWRSFRAHIKCRRKHNFSCCDTCIMYKERLVRLSNAVSFTSIERSRVMKRFKAHLDFIRNERAIYARHTLQPLHSEAKALSVIIDGADQSKFGLPQFPTKGKREYGMSMKQKITGVLFHNAIGAEEFLCLFTSPPNLRGGANQTIDALCRGLFSLKEQTLNLGHSFRFEAIYIQLDNTAKDNKNRYMFAFCEYLVFLGVFKTVTVSFLPVGHTHEDIDRKFSLVTKELKERAICSVKDLHQCLLDSQKSTRKHVARITSLHNVSGALENQRCLNHVEGMKLYHKFVFKQDTLRADNHFNVSCKLYLSMSASENEAVRLEKPSDSIGLFLKHEPDMSSLDCPPYHTISAGEIQDYRKRISSTEQRINNPDKLQELFREVDWLESASTPSPEWNFSRINALILNFASADGPQSDVDHDQDDDVFLSDPFLSYSVGQMVAVNCGNQANALTPFWLGKIIDCEAVISSPEVLLTIHWYEAVRTSNCSPEIVSYQGKYRSLLTSEQLPFTDKIPSSSVLVTFEKLTLRGTIPVATQNLIKECLNEIQN